MKMTPMVVAILVEASAAIAFAVDVGTLPEADFADTEVSTNVVIDVSAEAPRRLRFSLELEARTCRVERECFGRACRVRLRREGSVVVGEPDYGIIRA